MAAAPDIQTVAQHAEQVCWNCLDGEAILLDLRKGSYYTLNAVGCDLWQCIDGKRTVREIGSELCRIYDAPQSRVEADVLALFDELWQEELITHVTQPPLIPPASGGRRSAESPAPEQNFPAFTGGLRGYCVT